MGIKNLLSCCKFSKKVINWCDGISTLASKEENTHGSQIMERQTLFTYVTFIFRKIYTVYPCYPNSKALTNQGLPGTASAILTNMVETKQKFQYKKYSPSVD